LLRSFVSPNVRSCPMASVCVGPQICQLLSTRNMGESHVLLAKYFLLLPRFPFLIGFLQLPSQVPVWKAPLYRYGIKHFFFYISCTEAALPLHNDWDRRPVFSCVVTPSPSKILIKVFSFTSKWNRQSLVHPRAPPTALLQVG